MQLKTINKIIRDKIEEWLESISDEELRKLLKKDVIVTGGCISSLFLQEDVNDFDVYIKTYDTLLKLTQYYCKGIDDIEILEGKNKKDLIDQYNIMGKNLEEEQATNHYGICLRNLKEDQIKIFIPLHGGKRIEKKDEEVYTPIYISPNAISLSHDVQIIIRFWGNPEEIHKNYDFVHATNYWTHDNGLVTNKRALESLLTKQLYYQGSLYPVTSIIRIQKFTKRKWRISAGETLKIVFQCSKLNLEDPDVLEEQLIGVDIAYFSELINALRGVGKEKMTEPYIFSIIDRIFN